MILKAYAVPSGKAQPLAKLFQDVLGKNSAVKTVASSPQEILVYGPPEAHLDIARNLQGLTQPIVELIPLASLSALRTATTLRDMLGPDLYLDADPDRNAIIVRGTPEQIQEVKSSLGPLGEMPPSAKMRIITLERANAETLADALASMFPNIRSNPVRVITPGRKGAPAPRAPAKGAGGQAKDLPMKPVLTLTAMGNKLIAACDDPEALALVLELVRLVTRSSAEEGGFEVIQLRFSKAPAVARLLEETFNGPGPNKQSKRVRIVADAATNSLLVKAGALDLFTIKRLLTNALDTDAGEGQAAVRTFTLGPLKHARAADMARVVAKLYHGEAARLGLVIAAEPRTNSLLLRCPPAVYQDIHQLVKQLDDKAASD
jgi:type II secretory pathway component GspD/PulD (secretin)